jgi:hypothetical protein
MLPIPVLQGIDARYIETRQIRGVIGLAYPVDLYLVKIQLGPHVIPSVRVIAAIDGAEAILGRDVLNHLAVTRNGPASITEIPF